MKSTIVTLSFISNNYVCGTDQTTRCCVIGHPITWGDPIGDPIGDLTGVPIGGHGPTGKREGRDLRAGKGQVSPFPRGPLVHRPDDPTIRSTRSSRPPRLR